MNDIVERFENSYSILEDRIRENYGPFGSSSPVYWWEREMLRGSDRGKMKMLRELRNLFAHNPTFDKGTEVAYPTEDAIEFLLYQIERASLPDSLSSTMVPYGKVLKAKLEDHVWDTIVKMKESGFSSVPIVNEYENVIGLLSEKLITSLLVKHKALCFSEFLKFEDLEDEVLFHGKSAEENFLFLSHSRMRHEAESILLDLWQKGRRIDMIFVTGNGKSTAPLMGILTPYDLYGKLDRPELPR